MNELQTTLLKIGFKVYTVQYIFKIYLIILNDWKLIMYSI